MGLISLPKKVDVEGTLAAIEKRLCESSLHEFIKRAWHVVEPGSPYIDNWHIPFITEHLEAITDDQVLEDGSPYNRLLINVPPGTMKSMVINIFWPAWEWGPCNQPHHRYICAAHQQGLAIRDSTKMRRLVTSDWYQKHWGDRVQLTGDQNAKTKFENTATGFREAIAAGSITGSRGTRVLCFPYDEVVHTENGPAKIGDVITNKSNVRVWSSAPGSEKIELKSIYSWKRNPGSRIVEIGLSDGTAFKCTPDHKIWTSTGWVAAGMLTSSHAIPRQSVSNRPDAVRGNPVFGGKGALGFHRNVNFKNLFSGEFRPTSAFTAKVIITFTNIRRKFFPCFATANLFNGRYSHSKLFGKKFGCVLTSCNDRGLFAAKFGSGAILMHRERTVAFGISDILGSRSIFKIAKSCVGSVAVFVPNLLPEKWWTNESQHDGLMRKNLFGDAVRTRIKSWVSLCRRKLEDLFGNFESATSLTRNDSGLAAGAAKIAYAIESLETDERFPVFIRDAGHADETFCLSVEDNHSFFVGSGKGVLVSNCDDPHSVESANSDAMRASTLEWFTEAVPTRLNSPKQSAIVVIMQRLHEEDVSGVILERKGFKGTYDHICLPMRYEKWRDGIETKLGYIDPRTEEGELLFPGRFPIEVVDDLEGKLGPYATAGQHQQAPTPRGGGIIKDSWWMPWTAPEFPELEFIVAGLDTAYSTAADTKGDYSALAIWGVFSGDPKARSTIGVDRYGKKIDNFVSTTYSDDLTGVPKVILMGAWAERLDIHELTNKVAADCKRFKVDKLLIENKAAGHSVAQEMRRLFAHEDFAVQMYDPKSIDKLGRLYSVQHLFSEGMIYAPDKEWAEALIRQVSTFPRAKHDDLVDVTSMPLRHLRDLGLLTRSPERIAEINEDKQYRGKPPAPLYGV